MPFVLLALLLLPVQEKTETIPFRVIDKDLISGFQAPQEIFIGTEKEWVELWGRRLGAPNPKKPHPDVDFNREVVVVACMGQNAVPGYSVEIIRIVRTKDEIQVFLKKTMPAEGTKPGAVVKSPFVLARMAKPDRPVRFLDDKK